jgi:hypothetical protein
MSDEDKIFDNLVLTGGLKFSGKDPETGENMYVRTEMLKDIDPNLDRELSVYFSDIAMKLWGKGFIDMDVTSANPIITLNKRSLDIEKIESLESEEKIALKQIIKILFEKE